jgi:O-antigen/teichoic acid export membrane protein
MSIPIFVIFFTVPEKIMVFLYGTKFIDAAQILKVLSLMLILKYLNPLIASAVTASGNQAKRTIVISLSLLVNILLNIVLIPKYNALGAAYSSVATETFITLSFLYIILKNKTGDFMSLELLTKFAAVLALILLSTFFVPELPLPLSVMIIFLMTFVFYLGLRIIHKDEMKHLFLVLKKGT